MLAALALAAAQCGDPGYCPDAAEFREAYVAWRDAELAAKSAAFAESGQIAMFHPRQIVGVTGLSCGKPGRSIGSTPPKVRCTGTLGFYYRGQQTVTMLLSRTDQGWIAEEPPERPKR